MTRLLRFVAGDPGIRIKNGRCPLIRDPIVRDLHFLADIRVIAVGAAAAEFPPIDTGVKIRRGGAFQRLDNGAISGIVEEGEGVSVRFAHGLDPVQGRPIDIVRPDLNHIADIDDEGAGDRFHIVPESVLEDLKAADLVLDEDRHRTGVAVMMDAEIGAAHGVFWQVR